MMKYALVGALAATMLSACGPSGVPEPAANAIVTTGTANQALTYGTWHWMYRENCMDIWEQACTPSFPSPQCGSSNPEGTACVIGWGPCYRSFGGGQFDDYNCY